VTNTLGNEGQTLAHYYEQCKLQAYKPVPTDPWTCGWGCTGKDSRGNLITSTTKWTQQQADAEFVHRMDTEFSPGVTRGIGTAPTDQNQFDAMDDLAFNIGINAFLGSTLLKKHNAGDYQGAADEFPKWSKSAGKTLKGLQRRRWAERGVYLGQTADASIQEAANRYP